MPQGRDGVHRASSSAWWTKFALGAVMSKALTLRGAQQHGHRQIPEILERMSRDETEDFATTWRPGNNGAWGYRMSKDNEDGCVRAEFRPLAGRVVSRTHEQRDAGTGPRHPILSWCRLLVCVVAGGRARRHGVHPETCRCRRDARWRTIGPRCREPVAPGR